MATRKVRRIRRRRRGGRMTTLNRKVVSKPAAKKIVRYHMNGCGACEMSKEAWNDFCNNPPDGVEHEAIEEADIPKSARIKAFPTYVVFENGRERNRKEGAITTKEGITQLLPG